MILGYDVIYGLMKFTVIIAWFLMAGVGSLFFMKFKPTARIIKKYFNI